MGDLRGVTARLPHLVALGVSVVWLSPFYPSPMADFGYDVSDFCGVDPVFGDLDDFDALVAAAHGHGLKVVVDWVPNHTSDQHPWFQSARASRASPFRDFYVWRDEPVNDWRAEFDPAAPAWTYDETAGQFYLHTFLPQQPELDWDNPAVAEAMHETLRFWLRRGVDGFRLDAIERIGKDPDLRDPLGFWGWQPALAERLRAIRAVVDEHPGRLLVGETAMTRDPAVLAGYVTDGGMDLAMDPIFWHLPWAAAPWRAALAAWSSAAAPAGAWGAWALGNHDLARVVTRYGERAARAAAVMLVALRGTPFLYAGDELGLPDAEVGADRLVDPGGRDPQRAPLPWTPEAPGYGFTSAARAWLPFVADAGALSAQTQADDPGSMLILYRRLLALRAREPALREGAMELVTDAVEDVLAWTRGDDLVVAVNFADAPRPAPAVGELLVSSEGPGATATDELRPLEAIVVRRARA